MKRNKPAPDSEAFKLKNSSCITMPTRELEVEESQSLVVESVDGRLLHVMSRNLDIDLRLGPLLEKLKNPAALSA